MQLIREHTWRALMEKEMTQDYWPGLQEFVLSQYQHQTCFPPSDLIFRAFELTPLNQIKVVILGQDPYHGVNQAHGLAFSVPKGVKKPPSLLNILKEVHQNTSESTEAIHGGKVLSGDLTSWAKQGVLLLNTVLTVAQGQAGSHQKKGWEHFTDTVIKQVSSSRTNVVFMLWGGFAKRKIKLIDGSKHLILSSGHPSPLSANRGLWFGNDHFSKANNYLKENGKKTVNW